MTCASVNQTPSLRLFVFFSAILAVTTLTFPSASRSSTCPELPGDPKSWTEQEQWAWKNICSGREADLRTFGGIDDPGAAKDWPAQRELSQRFLETVLLNDPYRSSIPRQGFKIVGGRFRETVDLSHAKLDRDLWLTNSSFEGVLGGEAVNLVGAEIGGHLSLAGSAASGRINLESLHAGAVSLGGGPARNNRWLNSRWGSIWLATARIDGQLDVSDSTVTGVLEMTDASVGTNLSILKSNLTSLILRFAKIGGTLSIQGPRRREDPLAGKNPCGSDATARPNLRAFSADLTGTTARTLALGSMCYGPVDALGNWGAGSVLILTSATVHTLQDGLCRHNGASCTDDTWPDHLKLTGFTYQELETFDADSETDMAVRPAQWWENWLKKQGSYSPQSYEYLAETLSKLGHKDTAKDILYAGKEREREVSPFPERIELWFQRAFIGYGYRIYYSLFWVVGFILLGAIVLRISHQGLDNKMPYGIAFSFDMLLPVIKLREYHYKVDLKGWVRYYFYFHKLMGYILASFLIAGLSGLTK